VIAAVLLLVASLVSADELENAKRVAELNPKEPNAWFNYAVKALEREKWDQAKQAAEKASQLDATSVDNWNLLATACYQMGDVACAEASWGKSLKLADAQDDVHYNLGVLKQKRAEALLKGAIPPPRSSATPTEAEALLESAFASYRKTLALHPGHEDALTRLGYWAYQRKQYAEAMGYYQLLLAGKPVKRDQALINLAMAALNKYAADPVPNVDDVDTCIQALDEAGQVTPHNAEQLYTLGVACYRRGYFDRALASFQRALHQKSDYYVALYNEGVCLYDMQRYDESKQVFESCVAKNPKDGQAELSRSVAYEEGVKYHLKRGNAYYIRGNIAGAAQEWNKVLSAEPSHRAAKELLSRAKEKFASELERHAAAATELQKAGKLRESATEWDANLKLLAELDQAGVSSALAEKSVSERFRKQAEAGQAATQGHLAKNEEIARRLDEAQRLEESGDFAGALKLHRGILEMDPKQATAQTRKAVILQRLERDANARAEVAKGFAKGDADLVRAENELEIAAKALEDIAELKAAHDPIQNELNRIRARKRELSERLLDEAKVLRGSGKGDQARDRYRRVLALNPDDPTANQGMRELSGQQKSAEKISAEQARQLYMEGVSLYVGGKLKSAVKVWEKILTHEGNHPDAVQSVAKVKAEIDALEKRGILIQD